MSIEDKKAQLLKALRKSKGLASDSAQALTALPRNAGGQYDLSYSQEQLWLLYKLNPGSPVYNIPSAILLKGELDLENLQDSFNVLFDRHESLRNRFVETSQGPKVEVIEADGLSIEFVDCVGLSEEKLNGQLLNRSRAVFSLESDILIRVSVLKRNTQEHILLVVVHHIISDGWSTSLLFKDLSQLYNSSESASESLPPLPVQTIDVSVWQREQQQSEKSRRDLEYWQKTLEGTLPVLRMPMDQTRPKIMSFDGQLIKHTLPKELSNKLTELGQQKNVTPFMLMYSAFVTLLHKYTAMDDILVGAPVGMRSQGEVESLIGFFINTLVMRSDLSQDLNFDALLAATKKTTLDAFDHQNTPLTLLAEKLNIQSDLSYNPIFQVLFAFQNVPETTVCFDGIEAETISQEVIHTRTAKVDISLVVESAENGFDVFAEFNTEVFSRETIEQFLKHFHYLLDNIVAAPTAALSQLNCMDPQETDKLLNQINQTQQVLPEDDCVLDFVLQAIEKNPEAAAVVEGERVLTYKDLGEKSRQLALFLQEKGIGTNAIVGVYMDRNIDLVVSLLAVMRAGAAYLPIDPGTPSERVDYILGDAKASLLITQTSLASNWQSNITTVLADQVLSDSKLLPFLQAENLQANHPQQNDLAYVIYTSGSTGKPKGVTIQHRGLLNLVRWHQRNYDIQAEDCGSHLAGLGFDAAVWELWPYLASGARVVLCDTETRLSATKLLQWLKDNKVTVSFIPTPLCEAILEELNTEPSCADGLALKFLLTGGDKLRKRPHQNFGFRLINHYGPTENTVVTTAGEVILVSDGQNSAELGTAPNIGKAIDNTKIYVLDEHLNLVPFGARGKLYASGVGISSGYLNQPELTKERFIPNPYARGESDYATLYDTGDIVCFNRDNDLEFLERDDFQVKIRGLRIELGEIESALLSHPGIKQGIVIAEDFDNALQEKKLLAYYQSENGELAEEDLRQFLHRFLPDYMLPSFLIPVESFKLTANGKIDRKALPLPSGQSIGGDQYQAPETKYESALVELWAENLGIEPENLGTKDNFFQRGGHSLLATKLIATINRRYGIELPVTEVFQFPTMEHLAQQIEIAQTEKLPKLPDIVHQSTNENLPASQGQQRLWYLDQLDPGNPVYNIPLVLQLQGNLNIEVLQVALDDVINKHDALRTHFGMAGTKSIQIVNKESGFVLAQQDLRHTSDEQLEGAIKALVLEEFNVQSGPLLRGTLIQHADSFVLVLVIHHIIFDGSSSQIFVDDLSRAYRQRVQDPATLLAKADIQFADYAVWQNQLLEQGELNNQLAVWQARLSGNLPVLEMPLQFPRPSVQSAAGNQVNLRLNDDLVKAIESNSQQQQVTFFIYTLSLYYALLFRYTQQTDIIVGTTIANRRQHATQSTIGFFVNTLALRVSEIESITFAELVQAVKSVCLEAYANQDLPFAKLVEALSPPRDPSRTPVFQTLFSVFDRPLINELAGGLTALFVRENSQVARTDLSFSIEKSTAGHYLQLEYCSDLFSQGFAEELLFNYETLLAASLADPTQKIAAAALINPPCLEKQLQDWNTTELPYEPTVTQLALFKKNVSHNPEKAAVVASGQSISYQTLNEKILRLANHLATQGIGEGDMVAICVNRSELLVVAMLAVFHRGACYLPLDPEYPEQRIRYILEDSASRHVLMEQELGRLFDDNQANLIDVPSVLANSQLPATEMSVPANPEATAYVIYTSGSTGNPKGVMVSQGNLVNFIHAMAERPEMNNEDKILAVTTLSFDIAVLELLAPLALGATTVIADRDTVLNPPALAKAIEDHSITLMQATPSAWQALLAAGWQGNQELKLLVGGEALSPDLAKRLVSCVRQVWNMYGPTETTVWSSCYRVLPTDDVPLIGTPIANTQLYVLDTQLQATPLGVPGELYIGGDGVSQGYFGKADLTSERFIANSFGEGRLYRTGDQVRYREDGNLEYLSRLDNQVKIRGFRIELGEIESVIEDMPAIRQAVVIVREDRPGDVRLVAYYILDNDTNAAEIRKHSRTRLPNYMVPQHYMELSEFPLTPNGKIDRRALPPPYDLEESGSSYVAPRNPFEQALASIWQEILDLEKVSVNDNFFELGGHSLLSFQVIAKVKETLGVQIPLRAMVMDTLAHVAAQYAPTEKNNDKRPEKRDSFAQRMSKFLKAPFAGQGTRRG